MPGLYSKYIKLVHSSGDLAAIAVSIALAYGLGSEATPVSSILLFLVCSIVGWFTCTSLLNTYKIYRVMRRLKVLLTAFKAVVLYIILVEAGLNIVNNEAITRQILVYHYVILTFLILSWRLVVSTALRLYRMKGYNYRKVVIVGYSKVALELEQFFRSHPEYGYRFLGFFDDKAPEDFPLKGCVADVEQFVLENEVDEIYCCPFELEKSQVNHLLEFVDNNLVRIKFLPEPGNFPYKKLKVDFYDMMPVLMLRSIPLDDAINKVAKRTFDVIFSLSVIIFVLSWLLPILGIIIKLDSRGPVFFRQERSGIDNKKFQCWKLRTMYVNKEANLMQARRGDTRITPFGAFLRKTSLDELPQFFNVLFGNMSVVGPRPHMLKHTQEYAAIVDKFMVRHFIKPGITGLSQIRGYRGDTSEVSQMRGRVKLDIFYLENWSFLLDLKIIFYTVYNVLRGDKHAF